MFEEAFDFGEGLPLNAELKPRTLRTYTEAEAEAEGRYISQFKAPTWIEPQISNYLFRMTPGSVTQRKIKKFRDGKIMEEIPTNAVGMEFINNAESSEVSRASGLKKMGALWYYNGKPIDNAKVRSGYFKDNQRIKTPSSVRDYRIKAFVRYASEWNKVIRQAREFSKTANLTIDDVINRENERERNELPYYKALNSLKKMAKDYPNARSLNEIVEARAAKLRDWEILEEDQEQEVNNRVESIASGRILRPRNERLALLRARRPENVEGLGLGTFPEEDTAEINPPRGMDEERSLI